MRGVTLCGVTLDGADFSHANFPPAEPSKPSAAPAQPPSAADSQPASAQEVLQALRDLPPDEAEDDGWPYNA